ncbi:stage III sporulation protein AA [Desertibacillus haloalkaliphilus]|uniref:stage III sporulation protein AA n=1 Tax=Desertibacillus haloalkaliphilus TaxID=1328930 RepID=UPI001C2596F2|nr:stage III sporulation protein AA [Desertibacillus haloalkaliphilus]MBU8907721.1 stage III sporulation protein AA [Desertibacillus haloalkaliphilus]
MDAVIAVLPDSIKKLVQDLPASIKENIEEIRIRIHRPLEIIASGKPIYPQWKGTHYSVRVEDAVHLLNQLSQYSLYAFEEELKQGFITIRGGHRVGLAGKVIVEKGHVKAIRDISSYNIRVARQKKGVATPVVHHLINGDWLNTLIIGPPQTGKTTLLRDIARLVSCGVQDVPIAPQKVGIIDERSEIAASVKGVPQHDLGNRIDVLDACPKADGMMMMIRSMSPDVLVVDEIGRKEDSDAIIEAINAGVKVVTTVHGYGMEDVAERPTIRRLLQTNVFRRCIELTNTEKPGTILRIRNHAGEDVVRLS